MMEDSLRSSSVNKSAAFKGKTDTPEESGWTTYLEDFLCTQTQLSSCSVNSFGGIGTSLLSDAASYVECKISDKNKFNFKKTRTKEISYDDSLEDTASSPLNSPKVGSLKNLDISPTKTDDHSIESTLGKGGGSDHHLEVQTDERNEIVFAGKNNDCKDLRKMGLCFVPLSMLVNYLG